LKSALPVLQYKLSLMVNNLSPTFGAN